MKNFTWKKLMSLVLVAALVIGCLQLNAKKVSADGEESAETPVLTIEPSAAVGESSAELEPAIVYAVTRTPGVVSEEHPVNIVIAIDTSGSMAEVVSREQIGGGCFPEYETVTRLDIAKEQAKKFVASLDENIKVVDIIGFAGGANGNQTIDNLRADGGTNIDAALELVEGKENVDALVILTDGEPTYATTGQGGDRFGNGSDTTDAIVTETSNAITRLTEAGVTIYAINFGGEGNIFEKQDNEDVINYSADFSADSLKAALKAIGTDLKNIYATGAYIEAVLGTYVKYVGNAAGVETSTDAETGITTLKWSIADYNDKDENSVLDPATPDLKFEVVVKDEEGNELTDKDAIVEKLLELDDPSTDADQIVVESTTDEEGNTNIVVKVAVTAKGQTFLHYFVNGVEQEPKAVDCTATEAVAIYKYTKPAEYIYTIDFAYGDDVVAVTTGSAVATDKITADYAAAAVQEGFDKADYTVKADAELELTIVAGGDNYLRVDLEKVEPEKYSYMIDYIFEETVIATTTGSAVDAADVVADYANAVAAEDQNKDDYKVKEGAVTTFKIVAGTDNYFTVDLEKVQPDVIEVPYTVYYKAGEEVVASYQDKTNDGTDVVAKALADAAVIAATGYDKSKYEVVAGQNLTFHVTVDFKEFVVKVQLKKADPTPTPQQKNENPLPPFATPIPTPDPEPTDIPATPTPTEVPTPSQIPVVDIEETETPEGDVDLDEVETPEGAPEEELDVEPIDTPQGDLPKTGVAPSAVFFGIGAACVVFGGMIVLKLRRKEEM